MLNLNELAVTVIFPSCKGQGVKDTKLAEKIFAFLSQTKVIPVLYDDDVDSLMDIRKKNLSSQVNPLVCRGKGLNGALEMGFRSAILNFPKQPVVMLNGNIDYDDVIIEDLVSILTAVLENGAIVIGAPSFDDSNVRQRAFLNLHNIISRGKVLSSDCSFQAFSSADLCSKILNGPQGAIRIIERAEKLYKEEVLLGLDVAMALGACICGIPIKTIQTDVGALAPVNQEEVQKKYEYLLKIGVAANILWG